MATEISIAVPELAALQKKFKQSPELVGRELHKGMMTSAILLQREARQQAPVDTGNLRNMIQVQDLVGLNAVAIQARAKYSIYVHEGSRPHFPPLKAITPWANRHGVPPFAVAMGIAKHGTKGKPFMRNAVMIQKVAVQAVFRQIALNVTKLLGD